LEIELPKHAYIFSAIAIVIASPSHAQSSVTVYGVIDTGLTYVSNAGGSKQFLMDDSVNSGTRLGFMGSEDLGGGLKAIFTLENGFNVNTGALRQGDRLFGRQAFVGLSNNFGTLTLGRGYDMIYTFTSQFDISSWASGYGSHQGNYDRMEWARTDNNVTFVSQDYGGVSFGGQYSFGNVAGNFHRGSLWSVGGQYSHAPFVAGIAYTRLNNPNDSNALDPFAQIGVRTFLGQPAVTIDPVTGQITDLYGTNSLQIDSEEVFTAGISYKLGKAQFMGAFSNVKFKGFGKTSNMPTFDVGGLYDISAFLIAIFGYQHTNFEGNHWNQISFGGDYLLSKRTDVYLATSYVKASDGVHANSTASFTPSSTNDQASVRIALRHKF